jgi:hypothetical protein
MPRRAFASGGGLVIPARRNHPPSRYPSVAIVLINPDCTRAEPNDWRSFALADQAFEVADGASNPIRKLLFRENFLHLATLCVWCRLVSFPRRKFSHT